MSAREEVEELLNEARTDGASADYLAGIEDALAVLVDWQRNSKQYSRAAQARRLLRRRKRLNDELIAKSLTRRKHYTYAEWLVIMDRSLTSQEAARRLGRTYKGIMHARRRLARGYKPAPDAGTVGRVAS